jgi:hypothetical protein
VAVAVFRQAEQVNQAAVSQALESSRPNSVVSVD